MKKSLVFAALLLAAIVPAYANIVVVPSEQYCKEQKPDPKTQVGAACAKMAKGEPVDLAYPIQTPK